MRIPPRFPHCWTRIPLPRAYFFWKISAVMCYAQQYGVRVKDKLAASTDTHRSGRLRAHSCCKVTAYSCMQPPSRLVCVCICPFLLVIFVTFSLISRNDFVRGERGCSQLHANHPFGGGASGRFVARAQLDRDGSMPRRWGGKLSSTENTNPKMFAI